jgi:NitT/TauT family transport system permease protein
MSRSPRHFKIEQPDHRRLGWGDLLVLVGLAVVLYLAIRLALGSSKVFVGPEISLSPLALPYYAGLSIGRMAAAYVLSLVFSLVYGYLAARNRRAERVLIPLLDILQSVPLLSFLPLVLLSFRAILPQGVAVELASIVLIFTSQAWNLTFAWYQSLITLPKELREASALFRFPGWLRFRRMELPFAAIALIWNSVMSWSGGWFFLMAAEIFAVGDLDFRLPGMGAYLQEAARRGDVHAIAYGMGALVLVIVALDQLLWRPLLAWADRFKLEMVEGDRPPASWIYDALRSSRLAEWFRERVWLPMVAEMDDLVLGALPAAPSRQSEGAGGARASYVLGGTGILVLAYGAYRAGHMLTAVSMEQWGAILLGLAATLGRVAASLLIAMAWTIPLGVAIGTKQRLATVLQPLVQITASIPATALFPVLVLFVQSLPGGLDLAAVLLMLMGTQWYLLFNVIAGAMAIPQDLKYTSVLLHLGLWRRWRTLILPSLFPYMVTGAMVASGGAWNASIVAEYVHFGGEIQYTTGIGSIIAQATAAGDYPLLLAATLSMVLTVIAINRLIWRRLYQRGETLYRLE